MARADARGEGQHQPGAARWPRAYYYYYHHYYYVFRMLGRRSRKSANEVAVEGRQSRLSSTRGF